MHLAEFDGLILEISPCFDPLFFPYIPHEQTPQNGILSVCSLLIAHLMKSLLRSGNQDMLKSDERSSDLKERTAQLWLYCSTSLYAFKTVMCFTVAPPFLLS